MESLPAYITDVIKELYAQKTYYKALERHLEDINASKEEIEEAHLNLMLSKARLNGIFGCLYSRIIRDNIQLNFDTLKYEKLQPTIDIDKYYKSKNSCIPYIGSLVTSYARLELLTVIEECIGYDNILYMDTDSCFYRWTQEIEDRIKAYNEKCQKEAIEKGLVIEYKSYDGTVKRKILHKFDSEYDSRQSKTFKTLHAKCYALEPNGQLKCTIAGVSDYNSDKTISREEELGSIDNLKNGFVFNACGGTRADYSTIKAYDGVSGGGCVIIPTEKTMHEVRFNEQLFIVTDGEIKY